MNTLAVLLSSSVPYRENEFLNGYLFIDPVYEDLIEYPLSATGDNIETLSGAYTKRSNAGLIFPYGYPIIDTVTWEDLPLCKGDTTVVFLPSALEISTYAILKIVYNWERQVSPLY